MKKHEHALSYGERLLRVAPRGYEAPKTMAVPVRTNQVNQAIRHQRTTFGKVAVNVNKRSVSADARAFVPNYLLDVVYFILKAQSKIKSQRDSNDNLVNSLQVYRITFFSQT